MKCNLCQKETRKYANSHVIATAIHHLSARAEHPEKAKILSSNPAIFPKKSPTGVYDQFICSECEKIFQPWEDYALSIFKKTDDLPLPSKQLHIKLGHYDYSKLKLFFVSLLWKADLSTQNIFKNVNVGERHRETLRQMIWDKNPGDWDDYTVHLERFNSDRPSASAISSPHKSKMGDILFYTFYMAGFIAHVKCDNRKPCVNAAEFFLKKDCPLFIPLVPFEGSREHVKMLELVKLIDSKDAAKITKKCREA